MEPPLTSKLTEAMPTGLEAPASSQELPVMVAPFEGIPTNVVGGVALEGVTGEEATEAGPVLLALVALTVKV
jgi:hypothetical protein